MPKVTIDGHEIEVPRGTTILQAARMLGKHVAPPAMCYYSKLKTSGGYCRKTCRFLSHRSYGWNGSRELHFSGSARST
jgi:predicted molibdopterin-dependent oxidoreductase YjgC